MFALPVFRFCHLSSFSHSFHTIFEQIWSLLIKCHLKFSEILAVSQWFNWDIFSLNRMTSCESAEVTYSSHDTFKGTLWSSLTNKQTINILPASPLPCLSGCMATLDLNCVACLSEFTSLCLCKTNQGPNHQNLAILAVQTVHWVPFSLFFIFKLLGLHLKSKLWFSVSWFYNHFK